LLKILKHKTTKNKILRWLLENCSLTFKKFFADFLKILRWLFETGEDY